MNRTRPLTSLSLDLDNKWTYLKTHGDSGWESFPSYLDVVVPRVLSLLKQRGLTITVFVVGQDAVLPRNRTSLAALAAAGHEIGNHSFCHEPWLHLYSQQEVEVEFDRAEEAIEQATGCRPIGFRGPGYSLSPTVLRVLARRGYRYDASTFPTFLGPLARAYYFLTAKGLSEQEKRQRSLLFGSFTEGFRPLRPYRWHTPEGSVVEIPVTTMPFFRVPIHFSYLLYLGAFSTRLALAYFVSALGLCRLTRTAPSLLLHPLDFLGQEDAPELAFFPAMKGPSGPKLELVDRLLGILQSWYQIVPMRNYAESVAAIDLPGLTASNGKPFPRLETAPRPGEIRHADPA
jgi:peptidoglycan-N-acetylglucosamine deacetylase